MSGRLAFGANQRPLAKPQETQCDMIQPPNSKSSAGMRPTISTDARIANEEVMKQDSKYGPVSTKERNTPPPCQNNSNAQTWKETNSHHGLEEQHSRPSDQVVPNWPLRPDTASARRDSVIAGDDEIQYKICSLKDYSQISSLDQTGGPMSSNSGYSPTKQLVKSLSQDRKMVGLQAKRMSECIYTSNSRRMVGADEVSSSGKPMDTSGTTRTTRQHQLGAESKIERVCKLFVAPLSLRPISGKQQQGSHNQIGVATSSSDVLPGTSKQQRSPMRQKGGKSFRVYGCPLHLANNIYPITCFGRPDIYKQQSVPYILARLCNYIEENSSQLTHEGIFRVNGNARLMGKLRTLFDHLGDAPLESESVDVATSASMLKMYLRELPEPLIPARMNYYFITLAKKYSVCLNTANSPETSGNGEPMPAAPGNQQVTKATGSSTTATTTLTGDSSCRRNSAVKERQHNAFSRDLIKLVRKLPIENYNLLKYLACFLHRISLKQEHNKMCAQALGIVFGPNVFRVRSESFKGLKEQELSNKIMSSIISNYRCIFDAELTDPLGNLVDDVCTGSKFDGTGVPEGHKLPSSDINSALQSSSREKYPSDDKLEMAGMVFEPEKATHNSQQDNTLNQELSLTIIPVEAPEEPPNDVSVDLPECQSNAEADSEQEDEEDSYTISSGSESYCSSDFSHSLASSYDDDDDNNEENDDEEDGRQLDEEDEEEEEHRGARSRRTYLNRKHISSSECRSETSYTPTSSHSDEAEEGDDQEDWGDAESFVNLPERRGSCAACTCQEPAHNLTSSSATAKSISSKKIPSCDKMVSSASASLESRRLNKRSPLFQVQRESSRKGRPPVGGTSATSNSIMSPASAYNVATTNRQADSLGQTQAAASRKSQQFLGVLLRRRSSSASSLSRVRRQSRQRFSSREEQRVRLQKTRIRRARARGVNPTSASKRLAAIQQRNSFKNHITSDAASVAAARCISGSDRSYLAGDEVSSLAHTDEPESLMSQVPQVPVSYVGSPGTFNSDENLVVSISGVVQHETGDARQKLYSCTRSRPIATGCLGGQSKSVQRGSSGQETFCLTSGDIEPAEMMQCSLVSLLAAPSTVCGSGGTSAIKDNQSIASSRINEFRVQPLAKRTDHREPSTELYSWSDHVGSKGSYSGFRGGEDSLLSQMRANKALARQLKTLIRHAKMLGGFSHQMELLVGRIQPQQHRDDTPQEYNELTTMAWHVDYLSTLDLASQIEHHLDQCTQSSAATDKPSDNFTKLAGLLSACITKLNRRYESLKAICEHNLRNHSNCSHRRATSSRTTPASCRRLSSSEPSVSEAALIEHVPLPSRTSEPSLFVMQSSGSDTNHHQEQEEARDEERSDNDTYCCFGPLCPSEFVCKIEGQLAAKRRRAGRLVGLTDMSAVQLAAEKMELQKNLLRYEHWFGRPTDRLHIGLVGHIYERYRLVKQLQKANGTSLKQQ